MTRTAIDCRRLIVRGRVQGVGYRWWMVGTARGLGLSGWVRNRPDGSVEALAMGMPQQIDTLIDACRRGPTAAAVRSVEAIPADPETMDGFEQRPTG